MSRDIDALEALRDLLDDVVPPGDATVLGGVYVWPNDHASVPDVPVLPMIVVAKHNAPAQEPDEVARKAHGLERRRWTADILVYVAEGPLVRMDDVAAEAEMLADGWVDAIGDVLWAHMTLSGTAVQIGRPNGDVLGLFTSYAGHLYWGTSTYWGLHFRVPVIQTRAVEMRP